MASTELVKLIKEIVFYLLNFYLVQITFIFWVSFTEKGTTIYSEKSVPPFIVKYLDLNLKFVWLMEDFFQKNPFSHVVGPLTTPNSIL